MVWHIDFDEDIFEQNVVNNTASHQYVDLIEANDRKSESFASGHTFPGSANVTEYTFIDWRKKETGVKISDIRNAEAGNDILCHAVNTAWRDPNSGSGIGGNGIDSTDEGEVRWYNLQGIEIDGPRDGEIVIRRTARGSKLVR